MSKIIYVQEGTVCCNRDVATRVSVNEARGKEI